MESMLNEREILQMIDKITAEEISPADRHRQIEDRLRQLQCELYVSSRFEPHRGFGFLSRVKGLIKKAIQKLLRWYLEPIIAQQNSVNEQIVSILLLLVQSTDNLKQDNAWNTGQGPAVLDNDNAMKCNSGSIGEEDTP